MTWVDVIMTMKEIPWRLSVVMATVVRVTYSGDNDTVVVKLTKCLHGNAFGGDHGCFPEFLFVPGAIDRSTVDP